MSWRKGAIVLLAIFAAGCAVTDPTGYLAKSTGALQDAQYAMALVYAAKNSSEALTELTQSLAEEIGKARLCVELAEAVRRIKEEAAIFRASGYITEEKFAREALRRLENTEYIYCH